MPNSGSDPTTDHATDHAIYLEAKSWDIEKILSYVMGRYCDSFTHPFIIVYGWLNTFLPILKIFDSWTPPHHPIFRSFFRWIVVKNHQKSLNRQNREKSLPEFCHLLIRNALPGIGFLADFQLFLGSLSHFWSFFVVHKCLWYAMKALHSGVRWRKLSDMAKMLKSPKSRKMIPNWHQMSWNDHQMTFNDAKCYHSILK